jgi:diadenosine tetraphosphatase ApaH/serine/threonine PP2A family protein phosphatase
MAAIIDGSVLCLHGGLSPEVRTLDQIRVIARAQEIPHEGAFCDLMWSDPDGTDHLNHPLTSDIQTWAVSPRGAGWLFGDKVALEVPRLYFGVDSSSTMSITSPSSHELINSSWKATNTILNRTL